MNVEINFLGDIALFKKYELLNIDPLDKILLPKSDYNIANFEFIIPNNRNKYFYDVNPNYKISFEYLKQLNINKIQAYSLANNHSMDYGIEGLDDVKNILSDKNIKTFGFGNKRINPLLFEINGISFCIIGCVKNGRWSKIKNNNIGPDSYDKKIINEYIVKYKENVDHIIIYPHWGTELVEIPQEDDIKNAKEFIDKGASAVIGHHPHTIQGIEKYKDGIIAYSLGSFIYIPEEELGYTKEPHERNYSICLNLKFSKNNIINSKPCFYKYDKNSKLPIKDNSKKIIEYFDYLNKNINNSNLYNKKVKSVLLKREIYAFFTRFKSNPLKTSI